MRIDAIATSTYVATLAAPIVTLVSIRLVRDGRQATHRTIQVALLAMCWLSVLALELKIRLAGGSGSLVATAQPSLRAWARGLLLVHVAVAVATYVAWTWLAFASQRRFRRALPGSFSRRHRRTGRWIVAGLWFTAASATGMYVLIFVA